jgi:hypothetical protein
MKPLRLAAILLTVLGLTGCGGVPLNDQPSQCNPYPDNRWGNPPSNAGGAVGCALLVVFQAIHEACKEN